MCISDRRSLVPFLESRGKVRSKRRASTKFQEFRTFIGSCGTPSPSRSHACLAPGESRVRAGPGGGRARGCAGKGALLDIHGTSAHTFRCVYVFYNAVAVDRDELSTTYTGENWRSRGRTLAGGRKHMRQRGDEVGGNV